MATVVVRKNFLPQAFLDQTVALYVAAKDWVPKRDAHVYGPEAPTQIWSGTRFPQPGERYRTSLDTSESLRLSETARLIAHLIGGHAHHSCYRMKSGDFFRVHTDSYFDGGYAHTLYLTPRWEWDWGGVLMLLSEDGESVKPIFPEYNSLVSVHYKGRVVPHFVTPITEWAQAVRYTLVAFGGSRVS